MEVYQGRLEELVDGEFILKVDTTTGYINHLSTVTGREDWLVHPVPMADRTGFIIKILEVGSSRLIKEIPIPYEGPNALKGGRGANYYVKENLEVLLVGSLGRVGLYNSEGKKIKEWEVDFTLPTTKESYVTLSSRKGLMVKKGAWLQVGQDPKNHMKFRDEKARLARVEFPLDFTHWLSQINLQTSEVRHTNFTIPGGNEAFQGDITATWLMGALDTKRGDYYLGWPYSDTLYRLDGVKLLDKVGVKSRVELNYKPSERIPVGKGATTWVLHKEASQHIFVVYDRQNDLFVRGSKVNESGEGKTKFDRIKHYVLQVFSPKWDPLGEYFFDFKGEKEVENWFVSNGFLYINKPERLDEDEYEFYRIDLGRSKGLKY
ncbi:hypothetical protein GCM10011339_31200 [Echinicola rosea]|uniref:Uncharacterized protein n=1 Tax=Echinicola rosea TaxID=1807691 RepID=A0ABQ1V5W2_9BACT|nr:hypothetical protein GCM10011339_31200 [Echinicola rosea]